jgi:hypothetical protein
MGSEDPESYSRDIGPDPTGRGIEDPPGATMDTPTKTTSTHNVKHLPVSAALPMALDMVALDAARQGIDQGAVMPGFAPWRAGIIALLNDSLATELVCVLRYKRHHFTAQGLASPKIADEFLTSFWCMPTKRRRMPTVSRSASCNWGATRTSHPTP